MKPSRGLLCYKTKRKHPTLLTCRKKPRRHRYATPRLTAPPIFGNSYRQHFGRTFEKETFFDSFSIWVFKKVTRFLLHFVQFTMQDNSLSLLYIYIYTCIDIKVWNFWFLFHSQKWIDGGDLMGFWWPWCLFYCFIIIWASVGLSTVKVCTSSPELSAQFSVYSVLLKWVFVLDAGLALLRFRERVIRDPYGVLGNWNSGGGEDDDDPCSWFGVECSDGKVISLWVFISFYVLLLLYLIFLWLNQSALVILFLLWQYRKWLM